MAYHVFPSEVPLGSFQANPSNRLREYQWAQFEQYRMCSSLPAFKISGGALSDGGGLTANIAVGEWMIDGRWVSNDAIVNTGTLHDNDVNYVRFVLTYTGNLVTSVSEWDSNSSTAPGHDVLVGRVTCDADSVTLVESSVALNSHVYGGSYTGNGSHPRTIFLGCAARLIEVSGAYSSMVPASLGIARSQLPVGTVGFVIKPVGTINDSVAPVLTSLGFTLDVAGDSSFNHSGRAYQYTAIF
jgi:hypothetical protein